MLPSTIAPRTVALKGLLLLGSLPNLFYGFSAMFWQEGIVKYSQSMSQASVSLEGDSSYLLKLIGLFVFLNGAGMFWSSIRPSRSLVLFLAVVLLCRGLQRLLFTDVLYSSFGVPVGVNAMHSFYALALGCLIAYLAPKRQAPSERSF
jgi:hypothetical protein